MPGIQSEAGASPSAFIPRRWGIAESFALKPLED